ncbi:MAG: N-formylglutamate amidohydrolase [Coriobacteriia bacterium]|nr:N-formylglutamate amidohydrolase [Coriobacteriia bacterium]
MSESDTATVYPFRIITPGESAPIVAHVPHSAWRIAEGARPQFLLSDDELRREVVRLTDWHVDELYSWVTGLGARVFINTVSRLIFDPERFVDDSQEPMAAVGQGAFYTHSTQGELLRELTDEDRARLTRDLYEPYHEGLSATVDWCLERFGSCLILDCHSFATTPLPSEPSQDVPRPDICIGTDSVHTPARLAEALEWAFRGEKLVVERDTPFAGTLVPLKHYRCDPRVQSLMIEVRRGLYCDESTGEPNANFDLVRAMLERVVTYAVGTTMKGEIP